MLMSATVSEEVEKLNKLILHSPVTLNLLDQGGGGAAGGDLGAGSGVWWWGCLQVLGVK